MPEYAAPTDDADLTASQMLSAMRDLDTRTPSFPKSEGWFTAFELQHIGDANMSHATLHRLLEITRGAGRLEEHTDWRCRGTVSRRVPVYRITPEPAPTPEIPTDES